MMIRDETGLPAEPQCLDPGRERSRYSGAAAAGGGAHRSASTVASLTAQGTWEPHETEQHAMRTIQDGDHGLT